MAPRSSILDIAQLLASDALGAEVQADNPYYEGQKLADDIGQIALNAGVKNYKQYSPGDIALSTGLSGLVSGLFGGMGDSYQNDKLDDYEKTIRLFSLGQEPSIEETDLSPSLFGSAKRKGSLFRIKDSLAEKEASGDLKKEFYKALLEAENPKNAERIMSLGKSLNLLPADFDFSGGEEPIGEKVEPKETSLLDLGPDFGVETLNDKEKRLFSQFLDEGYTTAQAAQSARETAKDLRGRTKELFTSKLKDLSDNASSLEELVRTGEEGINLAGTTGSKAASWYEKALSTLAPWNTPEADRQVAGDALLSQAEQKGAMMNRVAGTGALSDRDMALLRNTAMSPEKPNAANQKILDGYRLALQRVNDQKSFLNYFIDKTGGSPELAQQMWDLYKEENRLTNEDGSVNINRVPWQNYDFKQAYERFIRGENPIKGTPQQEALTQAVPQVGGSFNGEKVLSVKKIR